MLNAAAPLRARHRSARWLPAEQLHLTLVFLGSTSPGELDRLKAAIARACADWAPFEVSTGVGGGYVDERRGGVVWLRIEEGRRDVAALSRQLDQAMDSNTYARSDPRPHLTLARGVDEELLTDLQRSAGGLSVRWIVDRAVLFRSHTGPTGSRYEALADFPLRDGSGRGS